MNPRVKFDEASSNSGLRHNIVIAVLMSGKMPTAIYDPVLKRFRAALDDMYGARLERVVLFGSRARGDAHEDSDYDVAVFLHDLSDRPAEMNRLADLSPHGRGVNFMIEVSQIEELYARTKPPDAR
jgi:predicted nucleotidyltransferase